MAGHPQRSREHETGLPSGPGAPEGGGPALNGPLDGTEHRGGAADGRRRAWTPDAPLYEAVYALAPAASHTAPPRRTENNSQSGPHGLQVAATPDQAAPGPPAQGPGHGGQRCSLLGGIRPQALGAVQTGALRVPLGSPPRRGSFHRAAHDGAAASSA